MELAEQVVSLLAVFGLLAAVVWAFGRKSGRTWLALRRQTKTGDSMVVSDRLVLTSQHVLHLIRIGNRTVLLATHPQGVSFDPRGDDFSNKFRNAMVRTHEVVR